MSNALPPVTHTLSEQVEALRHGAGGWSTTDAVLVVTGADRVEWLAAMVTQDVKSMATGASRYAAIVHEKGKILADAWVHRRAHDLLLVVPAATVSVLIPHFEAHIIMEDVEVAPWGGATVIAVQGARAAQGVTPDGVHVFEADRLGWGGVNVIAEAGSTPSLGETMAVTPEATDIARLETGRPCFGVDFGSEHYVQEANLTARAVSFQKGCYLGQEVVCRLEMRGHVRRQLVSLVMEGSPPAVGTSVGGVGEITSSAWSDALSKSVALAMVKWDVASARGDVTVNGALAHIVDRPLA